MNDLYEKKPIAHLTRQKSAIGMCIGKLCPLTSNISEHDLAFSQAHSLTSLTDMHNQGSHAYFAEPIQEEDHSPIQSPLQHSSHSFPHAHDASTREATLSCYSVHTSPDSKIMHAREDRDSMMAGF